MNAGVLQKIVRAFTEAQKQVNTHVETNLVRAAEHDFGRQASCNDCYEPKHCCRMLVVTSLLDALPIAAHVLATGPTDLVTNLREAATRQRGMTATDHWLRQEPCVFLRDERCTIYDVRPLPCRGYCAWSDPRHCSISGESDSLITTEPSLTANVAVIGYLQALLQKLFGRASRIPYVDHLPATVVYAMDALQSKSEHRLMRKLTEAQTDLALLERRAQDVRHHAG